MTHNSMPTTPSPAMKSPWSTKSSYTADNGADQMDEMPSFVELFEVSSNSAHSIGRVVLVANDGAHPQMRISVSSCVLAMASLTFKWMLEEDLGQEEQRQQSPPDDAKEIEVHAKPETLKMLCEILHLRNPLEGDDCTYDLKWCQNLLDLAILAERFDCVSKIRLQTDAMLHMHPNCCVLDPSDRDVRLCAAAFILQHPHHFRTFTKSLVKAGHMLSASENGFECCGGVAEKLAASINLQQNVVRQQLGVQVTGLVDQFSQACNLAARTELMCGFMDTLRGMELWPIAEKGDMGLALGRLKNLNIPIITTDTEIVTETIIPRTPLIDVWGASPPYRSPEIVTTRKMVNAPTQESLRERIRKVEDLCVGVCLDCLKGAWGECRKMHRYKWMVAVAGWGTSQYLRYDVRDKGDYDVDMPVQKPLYWEGIW